MEHATSSSSVRPEHGGRGSGNQAYRTGPAPQVGRRSESRQWGAALSPAAAAGKIHRDRERNGLRTVVLGYPEGMKTIDVGTSFTLSGTAPTATFLRIRPSDYEIIDSRLIITDQFGVQHLTFTEADWPRNDPEPTQRVDRVVLPSGINTVTYAASVEVPDLVDPMPNDLLAPRAAEILPEHLWWLQPSRYCRPDELGQEAWDRFGRDITPDRPANGETVRNICSFVNQEMTFAYGSSTPLTSASEAWAQRRGVCRDFNHVAASFCRALNIPTRYVFGYFPDVGVAASDLPMDFSAWIEVCLDDSWWTFDARINEPRIGRIVVGRGRDAADVPMISTLGATSLSDFAVQASERLPHTGRFPELAGRG